MTKLQIDTIKSAVFLTKNLAETLKQLSKEYNFDINDGGSFSTQFRLTKSKGDLDIRFSPMEFCFNKIEKVSLKDYKDIKERINEHFEKYYAPVHNMYVDFGEMITEEELDYDIDDEPYTYTDRYFASYESHIFDETESLDDAVPTHLKGVYDNTKLKYDFVISYNHRYDTIEVSTPKNWFNVEEEVEKIRKDDPYFNEIYTVIFKALFDRLPKELETLSTSDKDEALTKDFKLLQKTLNNLEDYTVLTKPSEIRFAYGNTTYAPDKFAGLYMKSTGFHLFHRVEKLDCSFNVYNIYNNLTRTGSPLHPNYNRQSDIIKYLDVELLSENPKYDTHKHFKHLVEKYILSTFKSDNYINDCKIIVDISLNDDIHSTQHILDINIGCNVILVYNKDLQVIGTITGDLPVEIDTESLTINVKTMVENIKGNK